MSDQLGQIISGIQAAGEGSFHISLSENGKWVTAVVYGREAPDSDMAAAASYGLSENPRIAVRQVLDETGWADL